MVVYSGQEVQRAGAEQGNTPPTPQHQRMSVVNRPILNFTLEVTVAPLKMVNARSFMHSDTADFILFHCEREQLQRC